jgi:predicted ATPase
MQQAGFLRSQACERLVEKIPLLQSVLDCADQQSSPSSTIDTKYKDPLCRMQLTSPLETRIYSGGSFNAFKDAICLFVQSAVHLATPIVLLLDDLHWANECSLDVLHALVENRSIDGVLFVGTVDSESILGVAKVDRVLRRLRDSRVRQTRLALSPLIQTDVHNLVCHAICRDLRATHHLTSALMCYSKGNVALIWESLQLLQASGILQVDHSTGQYVWLDEDVRVDTMNVSDAIRSCVQNLTSADIEGIKLASCLGVKLDFDILCRLMNRNAQELNVFSHNAAFWSMILRANAGAFRTRPSRELYTT